MGEHNHEHEVTPIEKLDIKNNYIFKSIPLAFDESMSYYQTLTAILDFLENTVIPTVNNNATELNQALERITALENQNH